MSDIERIERALVEHADAAKSIKDALVVYGCKDYIAKYLVYENASYGVYGNEDAKRNVEILLRDLKKREETDESA